MSKPIVAGVGMIKFAKPGASDDYHVMAANAARAAMQDKRQPGDGECALVDIPAEVGLRRIVTMDIAESHGDAVDTGHGQLPDIFGLRNVGDRLVPILLATDRTNLSFNRTAGSMGMGHEIPAAAAILGDGKLRSVEHHHIPSCRDADRQNAVIAAMVEMQVYLAARYHFGSVKPGLDHRCAMLLDNSGGNLDNHRSARLLGGAPHADHRIKTGGIHRYNRRACGQFRLKAVNKSIQCQFGASLGDEFIVPD